MARNQRTYDREYKVQAVKLAQEIGSSAAAARELGISHHALSARFYPIIFIDFTAFDNALRNNA